MRSPAARVVRGAKARTLRIIGGSWRGRTWRFPEGDIRPTPDRVRETLFNWLAPGIAGVRCLDLFAGSGALGLECASRGAQQVVLVESHPRAAAALRELLRRLDGAPASVVQDDWQEALARLGAASFDLVLLDPPFDAGLLPRAVAAVLRVLRPGGLLYVESGQALAPAQLAAWPADLLRSGRAGAVFFHLLRTRAC